MEAHQVVIIGLGRVGSFFLEQLLRLQEKDIFVLAVCEPKQTSGKTLAREQGLSVMTLDEIILLGDKVDMIFELTGNPQVRRDLRKKLFEAGNNHTVIVSENVSRLVSKLISDTPLPDVHEKKGY